MAAAAFPRSSEAGKLEISRAKINIQKREGLDLILKNRFLIILYISKKEWIKQEIKSVIIGYSV